MSFELDLHDAKSIMLLSQESDTCREKENVTCERSSSQRSSDLIGWKKVDSDWMNRQSLIGQSRKQTETMRTRRRRGLKMVSLTDMCVVLLWNHERITRIVNECEGISRSRPTRKCGSGAMQRCTQIPMQRHDEEHDIIRAIIDAKRTTSTTQAQMYVLRRAKRRVSVCWKQW